MEQEEIYKKSGLKKTLVVLGVAVVLVALIFAVYKISDFSSLSNNSQDNNVALVKGTITSQLPSVPGEPIKWVKTVSINSNQHLLVIPKVADNVKISTTTALGHAMSKSGNLTNADRIKLSELASQRASSSASLALAKSIKQKNAKGFFAFFQNIFSKMGKLFATVDEALSGDQAPDTVIIDLSTQIPDSSVIASEDEAIQSSDTLSKDSNKKDKVEKADKTEKKDKDSSVIPAEAGIQSSPSSSTDQFSSTPLELTATSSLLLTGQATSLPILNLDISSFVSTSSATSSQESGMDSVLQRNDNTGAGTSSASSSDSVIPTEVGIHPSSTSSVSSSVIASTSEAIQSSSTPSESVSSSTVLVSYETPAPTIAEANTDTGKIVQVSAPEIAGPSATSGPEHLTNVLAFTNIPEIYKVGQESKIKIKWTNNGDQNVTFHAYDLNSNGKLDYVEWTVPHLSTQTFEIIFISKAFELDQNKEIINDIYDIVATQDKDYATVPNGNYVRVTFQKILDETKDITVYAKSTNNGQSASVEVYPVYTDEDGNQTQGQMLETVSDGTNPTFENISEDGKYRILLQNLQTPTDVFDLKISGNVDIDYIVDPVCATAPDDPLYTVCTYTTVGTTTLTLPTGVTSADVLVVAGGGGGSVGGGGGGGVLTGSLAVTGEYPVIVGAGGRGWLSSPVDASDGSNSVFAGLTAFGGGAGGKNGNGFPGGSGGGAGGSWGGNTVGGSATNGQGFAGGNNNYAQKGGGGGGASTNGDTASTSQVGGNGGAGMSNQLSGISAVYGGGGGGAGQTTPGSGGLGGGGAGGDYGGTAGTPNTGGGGGGMWNGFPGGNGGSGIVIVRYLTPANLGSGLVAHYTMNDDAASLVVADSVGSNTGTSATNTSIMTTSKIGSALSFNGTSDYVDAGNPSSLQFGTGDFSLSAWIKPSVDADVYKRAIISTSGGTGYIFAYINAGGGNQLYVETYDGTFNPYGYSTSVVTKNAWNYVTLVRTGGLYKFYINGISSGTVVDTAGNIVNAANFTIGRATNPGGDYFPGSIDDVRIYNTALDQTAIDALYASGAGTESEAGALGTGLVAHYKMNDDSTNTTVADSIGGHTGTAQRNTDLLATAKIGKAMSFNGTGDKVVVANSDSLNMIGKALTLSVWVNPASLGHLGAVLSKAEATYNGESDFDFGLWSNNKIYFGFNAGVFGSIDNFSSDSITSTGWHLITVAWNGTTNADMMRFYIDGTPSGTATAAQPSSQMISNSNLYVGGKNLYRFTGSIDDVRIYNTALSADDVLTLYNNGAGSEGQTLGDGNGTWNGSADGVLTNRANWTGSYPCGSASYTAEIPASLATYPSSGTCSAGTVTNNGTISGGTFTGSVINHSTISGGTFTLSGNYTQDGGSFTNSTAISVGGNLSVSGGTFAIGTNDLTVTGSSTVTGATTTIGISGNTGWTTAGLTVGAGGVVTATGASKVTLSSGNFDQSSITSRFNASTATITVNGNGTFTANGTLDSTQYNSASLVLNGTNTLTYGNNPTYWDNGFNNLTVGQSGNTVTLASHICIISNVTIGSGILTGSGNMYLKGATPLSFDAASTLSVPSLYFYGQTASQSIPALVNGYSSDIYVDVPGGILTQTGNVTLNTTKSMYFISGGAGRALGYKTDGYNLTIGGNITIGVGADTALKKLDATGAGGRTSTVTVGGNWLNYGTGTAPSQFVADNSTVIFNSTATGKTITSGATNSKFNNLTFNGTGGAWTLQDNLVASGSVAVTAGTLSAGGKNITTTGARNLTISDGALITASGLANTSGTYYNQVTVSGTLNPNAIGTYTYVGLRNGIPEYRRGSDNWYVSNDTLSFIITPVPGVATGNDWWKSGGFPATISGSYAPDTNYTGTATVANVTASGFIGSTITVGGNFSASGHSGALLTLNPASAWYLNVAGTASASYVNAAYSNASGGTLISQTNSTNGGNNTNWNFNTAPNAPTLVSPTTASYTTDTTPTLSAIYSDPDTADVGTTNYRIASSAVNCTGGTVVDSGTSAETASNNATTTWTPSSSIGSDATYYWCAQNNDGVATSSWTSMGNFILDTTAPNTATSLVWSQTSPASTTAVTASWTKSNSGDLADQKILFYTGATCDTISGSMIDLASNSLQTRDFTGNDALTYSYKIVSIDTATNQATSSCSASMLIDISPPVRSGGAPGGTLALNTSSTTISLTTNEPATCKYSATNISYASMTLFSTTTATTTHSSIISELSNGGSYLYYVKCSDAVGNVNSDEFTISFTVQADITAPTVSVTAPANNAKVRGNSVTVSANAVDDVSVSGVQFKLDGSTNIGGEDLIAPYTTTLDTTSLDDGNHEITAVARDGTGNQATSSIITVTVDNTVPSVSAGADKVKNALFSQTGSATDITSEVASYLWSKLSGPGAVSFSSTTLPTVNISANQDGAYLISLTATDLAGNSASSTFNLTWDTTAPSVSAGADQSKKATFTQTGSATDGGSGIASYLWSKVSGPGTINFGSATAVSTTISAGTDDGAYVIALTTTDLASNSASSTFNLTWSTVAPTISNILPVDGSRISNNQVVTFTLSEAGDCRLAYSPSATAKSYDGMSGDTSCSVTDSILISCTSPDLGGAGTKNIYLACEDAYGNKDTSGTATHLTYTIPAVHHGSVSKGGGSSTPVATSTYSFSINNGAGSTDQRVVNLQFSANPYGTASAVVVSTNPDFSNITTIPYVTSTYQYNLCQGQSVCPDANYTIYTKFLSPSGVATPAYSQNITLNAVPLITEVIDNTKAVTGQVTNTITDTITKIITNVIPQGQDENVTYPPITQSVPQVTPVAFQNKWPTVIANNINNFVFEGLPSDFQNIVNKFPVVATTLQKIGITKMSDVSQLSGVGNISLPGLSEIAGLQKGQSVAVTNFSQKQINQIPTDVIFAQTADGSIDLGVKLSIANAGINLKSVNTVGLPVTDAGLALQTLNTIQGQPLKFVVKPEGKASTVQGYMIFKSSSVSSVSSSVIASKAKQSSLSQTASVAFAMENNPTISGTTVGSYPTSQTDLVLNKFNYIDSGNGVWTAEVASPLALGTYELRTIINYKANIAPKTISMVVVVDPEGYVYKINNGEETRISNALVSIDWLNPATNAYELWPSSDFRQQNPQTTDVTGRYAFLVPVGTYKLKVISNSYSDYVGAPFKVDEGKGVFINIELKAKTSLLGLLNFQTILLGGIFLALIYLIFIFTIRRGKNN